MIKFKVSLGDYDVTPRIDEVIIEKETASSVWVNGNRCSKRANYTNYFDTREQAKAVLCSTQENRCNNLKRQLEKAEYILLKVGEL